MKKNSINLLKSNKVQKETLGVALWGVAKWGVALGAWHYRTWHYGAWHYGACPQHDQ